MSGSQVLVAAGLAVALLATGVLRGQEPTWTETFDEGVGRFTETRGLGHEKFVWNPEARRIDGEFERTDGGRIDRRYADIGRTLTHEDAFGFSAVVTPTDISPELHSSAYLGLWNSNQENMTTWVGVRFRHPWGISIHGTGDTGGGIEPNEFIEFTFGETYFVEFAADGNGQLTLDVYVGRNNSGQHLGSLQYSLRQEHTFTLTALGMGNAPPGSTTIWAWVDDVSLILAGSCDVQICQFNGKYKAKFQGLRVKANLCSSDGEPKGAGWRVCVALSLDGKPVGEQCRATRRNGGAKFKFADLTCGLTYEACVVSIRSPEGEDCTPPEPTCGRRIIGCFGP